MNRVKIFPSLISADLLNLRHVINSLDIHSDGYHLDVMDDHFVPNLTWGAQFINAIAHATSKSLFVHLMVEEPRPWLDKLTLTEKDSLTFHFENKIEHVDFIKRIIYKLGFFSKLTDWTISPAYIFYDVGA